MLHYTAARSSCQSTGGFLNKKARIEKSHLIISPCCIIIHSHHAGVLELVDEADSKSAAGNSVPVRARPPAPCRSMRFRLLRHFSYLPIDGHGRLPRPAEHIEKDTTDPELLPVKWTVKKETVSYGGVIMSKRKKIKAEDKIRIAKECVYGCLSQSAAAEQAGVDMTVVMDWIRLYQSEGNQAFLPRGGNRRYDPAVKEAAVKDYLSGRDSLRGICKIYKIRSTKQLREWIKVYDGEARELSQSGIKPQKMAGPTVRTFPEVPRHRSAVHPKNDFR